MVAEKFERPVRVVCLKRGPPVPFRRQSAYIHFATGEKPSSTGVTPWVLTLPRLPQSISSYRMPDGSLQRRQRPAYAIRRWLAAWIFPVAVYRSRWCVGPRSTGGMATWVLEENGLATGFALHRSISCFLAEANWLSLKPGKAVKGFPPREGWSSADGVGNVIIVRFALNFFAWKVVGNGYPSCWEMAD